LTINIISRIPEDLSTLWSQFIASAANVPKAIVAGLIVVAIIAAMVVFVVLLQDAQRKIPVQYSSKIRGNKQMGGQQTCIPLKVNTSGVIPVIFATVSYADTCYHCQLPWKRQWKWNRL